MTASRITYGDISRFLRSLGFTRTTVSGSHVAFRHPQKRGSLLLPIERAGTRALLIHVAMLQRMLLDFGILSEAEVENWIADPKHFQAA